MTLYTDYNPIRQQGNGVTTEFTYNFNAVAENYLAVYIEDANGNQTRTYDFTATYEENGGIVTLLEPPSSEEWVIVSRETPIDQTVPYKTSSGFDAKVVEKSYDKLTAIEQENNDALGRSLKFPLGYNFDVTLPFPEANKTLVWKEDESGLENAEFGLDEAVAVVEQYKDDAQEAAGNSADSATASAASASQAQYYAENVKFGMVRWEFEEGDWQLVDGKYQIAFDYEVISAVYRKNGESYELATNIDVTTTSSKIYMYTVEPFDGYALLVNSASREDSYTFEQVTADTVWTITHNLDKNPSVTVVDSAGTIIEANVTYTSRDECVITFNAPTRGKAYLN